ncbi:MAG: hypothetical protein IJU44_05760 [Kiritimatiellae bacterium]|nr:hypothetical protein [Kiritimatiellia bacterium]
MRRTAGLFTAATAAAIVSFNAAADTFFAKLVGQNFVYYDDISCENAVEAPETGLGGCTVLFASDLEFQSLVQYAEDNPGAFDDVTVALQNDITLTADTDWSAIDFNMNGKAVTLQGYDLKVHKPVNGRFSAGNLINPLTPSGNGSATWSAGGGWWNVGTSSKSNALWWDFTPPKSRNIYIACKTKKYGSSTYEQYIYFSVGGTVYMNYTYTGPYASEVWRGPWTKAVTGGTQIQAMVRRNNGYSMIGFVTISPESHLTFDVPEGEEVDTSSLSFGGASTSTYEGDYGLGLEIHKTGKGTLLLNKAWTMATQADGAISLVVEEGLVMKAPGMTAGGQNSRIVVNDGAQFDVGGTDSSASYDFNIAGSGPDGLGAIVNNTEVPDVANAAFAVRNITFATNAVIGGSQPLNLKNGNWAATTTTLNSHTLTYSAPTVYAGNVTYSGAGNVVIPKGTDFSFYGHNSSAPDSDVTIFGRLTMDNGGFSTIKSLMFEEGAQLVLSDTAGSGSIPTTVITGKYKPAVLCEANGTCTLTTQPVQLCDATHLEAEFDLSQLSDVFDGSNTTFYAGSTITVNLGTREFAGSTLLVAWPEMSTATFVIDGANKDRLGLWAKPEGLYVLPGKVPSFVKYDIASDGWKFYDEELNPYVGEWTLGMDYMKVLFADNAEFQALAQHTDEIAAANAIVLLQNDITLSGDADWRAIDFDMNGKTIYLMGWNLKIHKPQGTGRITAGNLIANGGFENGSTGWAFGSGNETVTANGNGVTANTCKDKPFAGNHWCVIGSPNDTAGATTLFTVARTGVCYIRFRYAKYDSNYAEYGVDCGIDSANSVVKHLDVKPYPQGNSSPIYQKTLNAGTHSFIFGRYYAWILVDEATVSPESHLTIDVPEGEDCDISNIVLGSTQNYFFDGMGLRIHKTGKGVLTMSKVNTFGGNGITSMVVEDGLVKKASGATCGEAYSRIVVEEGAQFDLNGRTYHDYDYTISGTGPDDTGALISTAEINVATAYAQNTGTSFLRNVTLATNATVYAGGNMGMFFYNYSANTMTMGGNTVTYDGNGDARIFAGNMSYYGEGKIVIATNGWFQTHISKPSASNCVVEVYGRYWQNTGILSPVKSLTFHPGSKFRELNASPSPIVVFDSYTPPLESESEDGFNLRPLVQLGDENHLEPMLDLSQFTETFDESEGQTITFFEGATVTVDIGDRTEFTTSCLYKWAEKPEGVNFVNSAAMRRRGYFLMVRDDGIYFDSGTKFLIR